MMKECEVRRKKREEKREKLKLRQELYSNIA